MRLIVATRRSALALAQARAFLHALCAANPGLEVEELHVVTSGDRIQDRPLYEAGGKGLFVKEIEEALLDGRADFAVHSMKDLPAALPPGLEIACVPQRADPRDVLLVPPGRSPAWADLPVGAKVGSSSQRRAYLVKKHRPDVEILPLRGNIDTRLRRLIAGDFDAILLAAAGLDRLGVAELPPHRRLPPTELLPAVAQGILAIEARTGDVRVQAVLSRLEHGPSRWMATAERGVLQTIGADCTIPLAAHVQVDGEALTLSAWLLQDGTERHASQVVGWGDDPVMVGRRIGAELVL